MSCVLAEKQLTTILVFGFGDRTRKKYHTQGEHVNYYITEAVIASICTLCNKQTVELPLSYLLFYNDPLN
jgi:hypothetical protein